MRRSIDDATDAHPASPHPAEAGSDEDDKPSASWMVQLADDCEACADLRVNLTVEEVGATRSGFVAHLDPSGARRLRAALADALKEVGEDPGR